MKALYFLLAVCILAAKLYPQSFTKITGNPLAATPGDSRSVNWVDLNNDGFLDCVITNGPYGGQNNMVYMNTGTGSFTALASDSIVLDNMPSDGATCADTDNDGDLDCFVANWYGKNNLFYLNNGSAAFTKVNSANLVTDGGYSETAAWGDYDNDGLVDLYVTNSAGASKSNFLYHNQGNNAFLKITSGAAATDAYTSRCVNWTDMDLDGDPDLFVTNEASENENIYRNDGPGVFTKLTSGPLLNNAGNTMSGCWGDYDNDGDLDVFLANDLANNALFRNDGNFVFTKITADTVSRTYGRSFSSAWSDVDNDGDLDLFVTNAFGTPTKLTNLFYLNNGNGSFSRISNTALVADSAWSYGCAFGDYDNDGFEDLAVATCRFGGIDEPDLLYHNNGNANNWITIQLTGTISNRAAIGAKVKIKAIINGNAVWQMREVSAQQAYCSQGDLRVHFGLGNATGIDSVRVEWPSGIVQHSTALATNQFLSIVESGSVTGVSKHTQDMMFSIFPNPSSGFVWIAPQRGFNAGDKIVLTDANGVKIAEISMEIPGKHYSLEFKKYNLSPGNYFISVLSNSGRATQQLIITGH